MDNDDNPNFGSMITFQLTRDKYIHLLIALGYALAGALGDGWKEETLKLINVIGAHDPQFTPYLILGPKV